MKINFETREIDIDTPISGEDFYRIVKAHWMTDETARGYQFPVVAFTSDILQMNNKYTLSDRALDNLRHCGLTLDNGKTYCSFNILTGSKNHPADGKLFDTIVVDRFIQLNGSTMLSEIGVDTVNPLCYAIPCSNEVLDMLGNQDIAIETHPEYFI